jgi:hypothetical protein
MRAAYGGDEKREDGKQNGKGMRVCGGEGRSAAGSLERLLTVRGGGRARRDESGGWPRLRYTRMRRAPMHDEATRNNQA